MQALIVCALIVLFLFVLGRGSVLSFFANRFFGKFAALHFRGGLALPFFYFYARNFKLILPGGPGRDRVFFEARKLSFWIDPFFLLIGRLRIVNLRLDLAFLDYRNRQESFLKNRILPRRHRVEVKNMMVHRGRVTVSDESRSPVYRLELNNIDLENADWDAGTPVDIFFRAARGSADIGSGRIEIGNSAGTGFIRLWGVTWGELAAVGELPFLGRKLALEAFHSGGSTGRHIHGTLGNFHSSNMDYVYRDGLSTPVSFAFDVDWSDYQITLDLGLQKLIGSILQSARSSALSRPILLGGRGVFEMIKKQEK